VGAELDSSPATGAERTVALRVGALFAGDERRVMVELTTDLDARDTGIGGRVTWRKVGGGAETTAIPRLAIAATRDETAATASRDGAVLASATSVLASQRQLKAAEAYERGDTRAADVLIQQNLDALRVAAAAAPAPAASALSRQAWEYSATKSKFAATPPSSMAGKALPKAAVGKDIDNMARSSY
jgi:Ca-activated chloride channel family protein